ncbi:tetratricopeptide repeat protein [Actinomadura sp. 21ATH]|uniref:serine/threonine-protein kinase n=1 Tax=Actinomadura sp. 21ATH TaxID=1735444 RepID=UPI0035C05D48
MTRCAQPGCTGSVQDDGFCDMCGMAPAPGSASAAAGSMPGSAAPEEASVSPTTPAAMASAPSGPSGPSGSSPTSGSSGRTATRGSAGSGSGGSTRRGMLGAGLVEVPPVPYRDPADAVMERPEVPESRRFCSRCGEPVGRGREGRPGRTEGFCRTCGHPFSFTPKLTKGELLGGQYEVLGCLAHGGLGWVYLARDHNVSGRWVVLKGLLDTGDADSLAAATAERAFLAEVEHPNIVKIYNFVRHGGSGYIVMEYVGGESLKDILLRRRKEAGDNESLPLGQVIAYGLEVLRALGYLHAQGLLYCDFKPDNAIQSEEQLKLIDLGGVRRAFDSGSPIFGTPGYQAPEIADQGPSVTSDLYTVGRTLAVLSFPFRGYTGRHLRSLPPRDEVPLLVRYESYYRLLRRATHMDPARRFQSAAEMAEQLTGVLREVLSADDGRPRPAPSALFGPERDAAGTDVVPLPPGSGTPGQAGPGDGSRPVLAPLAPEAAVAALPVPLVETADPGAGFLAGLTAGDPAGLAAALGSTALKSAEISLALARARIELGEPDEAAGNLDAVAADRPDDWRVDWYRGAAALAAGRYADAIAFFDDLYDLMPGERSPKLALAFAFECAGKTAEADRYYETVRRTDPTFVSAAFGLARVRLAVRDRDGAREALDTVPLVSRHYVAAQLANVVAAVRGRPPGDLDAGTLTGAGGRLESLLLDTERYSTFAAEVLEAGLGWLGSSPPDPTGGDLLGTPLSEPPLRRRLEETYRVLAKLAGRPADRHALVIRANAVRPRTLF